MCTLVQTSRILVMIAVISFLVNAPLFFDYEQSTLPCHKYLDYHRRHIRHNVVSFYSVVGIEYFVHNTGVYIIERLLIFFPISKPFHWGRREMLNFMYTRLVQCLVQRLVQRLVQHLFQFGYSEGYCSTCYTLFFFS